MEGLWWLGNKADLSFNTKLSLPEVESSTDVKIKVEYSGVCGSDFHFMQNEMGKYSAKQNGVILGHEFSGTVVAVGDKAAENIQVGDKVCVNPNGCCGECKWFKQGNPHFCSAAKAVGVKVNGGWAQYCVVPEGKVHKLPKNVSTRQGALGEPYSCILRGWKQLEPFPSKDCKVLVQGSGIIGILFCTLLHHHGFKNVTVSEPNDERRKLCAKMKFDFDIVHPQEILLKLPEDDADTHGFQVIIDCTGNVSAVEKTFQLACRGATICIFGCCPAGKKISIEPFQIYWKELKIVGSFINPFCFDETVLLLERLANEGYLEYDKMGIKVFALSQYKEALDSLKQGTATKVVFKFDN